MRLRGTMAINDRHTQDKKLGRFPRRLRPPHLDPLPQQAGGEGIFGSFPVLQPSRETPYVAIKEI